LPRPPASPKAPSSAPCPALNADIIDKGVVTGDTDYIWRTGGLMLACHARPGRFAIAAVYFGAKAAMGFGRDVRGDLFHRVTGFSAQEVARFGAPSLITRITNDVQQVQMLVLMSCTMLVAPDHDRRRRHHGGARGRPLSLLLLVSVPALVIASGSSWCGWSRSSRSCRSASTASTRCCASRSPASGWCGRSSASPRDRALRGRQRRPHRDVAARRPPHGLHVPDRHVRAQLSSVARSGSVRDRIDSGEMQIGALIAFLSYLVQILMSVMMATFVAVMAPRAAVCAERIEEVLDTEPSVEAPPSPSPSCRRALARAARRRLPYPGAEAPVLCDISFAPAPGRPPRSSAAPARARPRCSTSSPASSTSPRARCSSTASTCASSTPSCCGAASAWCPRSRTCSRAPWQQPALRRPRRHRRRAVGALEVAQAADFVGRCPAGSTPDRQGGTNVSGGQRQRLAIARALVRKPEHLPVRRLVLGARPRHRRPAPRRARPVSPRRRGVIVAQRVSTIIDADQILVLEDGQQVGLGTHDELLASCPTYVEIVASQMAEAAA
jgi:ATP-binding cassette subfamily B multidrug efflux pump